MSSPLIGLVSGQEVLPRRAIRSLCAPVVLLSCARLPRVRRPFLRRSPTLVPQRERVPDQYRPDHPLLLPLLCFNPFVPSRKLVSLNVPFPDSHFTGLGPNQVFRRTDLAFLTPLYPSLLFPTPCPPSPVVLPTVSGSIPEVEQGTLGCPQRSPPPCTRCNTTPEKPRHAPTFTPALVFLRTSRFYVCSVRPRATSATRTSPHASSSLLPFLRSDRRVKP